MSSNGFAGVGQPAAFDDIVGHQQQRPQHHRQRHREHEQIGRLGVEDVLPRREREQHERKLAARGQREAQTPGARIPCDRRDARAA